MKTQNTILRLCLLFFIIEAIVSGGLAFADLSGTNVWMKIFWDVAIDLFIIVLLILFMYRQQLDMRPAQLVIMILKLVLLIVFIEGTNEHLLQIIPFKFTPWVTSLVHAILFGLMAGPVIYYLVLLPIEAPKKAFVRTLSVEASLVLSFVISFVVFVFDISIPLGVAGGVPYVALVLAGLWYPQRNAAFGLAIAGTALTIIGYLLSEEMGITWMVLTNRALAIFAIWVTAILVLRHKQDIEELDLAAVVFNEAAGAITITDAENNIIAINPAFEEITGYRREDIVGQNPRALQSGMHDKEFYREMWQSLQQTGAWQGEIWNKNKSGEIYPERLSIAVRRDSKGRIINHIAMFQDISEQKKAEEQIQKKAKILNLLHEIATTANTSKTPNEALQVGQEVICSYTGWPIAHAYVLSEDTDYLLISSGLWHLRNSVDYTAFVEASAGIEFKAGDGLPGRVLSSGHKAWIDDVQSDPNFPRASVAREVGVKTGFSVPVVAEGDVVAVMEFFADETVEPDEELLKVLDYIGIQLGRVFERANTENRLLHLANHGALTGLPSIRLTKDRIAAALAQARRNESKAALLFIDLDGFKAVNDTLGHEAGDVLLQNVAKRLASCVREVDTVSRIGGDEFLIVLTNIFTVDGAEKVAKSVIETVSRPFDIESQAVNVGASIGIALYPDNGTGVEELLKNADEAMYDVKHRGKNNYTFSKA